MTEEPITILMAASEGLPFAKTGGLADVIGALPPHLARLGVGVKVVIPYHREAASSKIATYKILSALDVPMGPSRNRTTIYRSTVDDLYEVYLVRHDPSFDRPAIYGPPGEDYPDNARRFALFSRAVVQLIPRLEVPVDLVHCHDWQTALVPLFLAGSRPSVFTVHNIGYQGVFDPAILGEAGIPQEHFHPEGVEFWGRVNFMKAGIIWSDAVTTVSPRYAMEMQEPERGFGLDGLLRKYAGKLRGILNGADYDRWDPAADPHIAAPYRASDTAGKAVCKRDLLRVFDFPAETASPVIGMTTRLVSQKGIDLLLGALSCIGETGALVVILGSGDPAFQDALSEMAQACPFLRARIGFDEHLAHKIVAGSDLYLMPSRYEPCGLSQMYALKYGTVPVVRATGGLMDTVDPFDPDTGEGAGFVFEEASPEALLTALRNALDAFARPELWRRIMHNGMSRDYSWTRSAERYLELYREVLAARSRKEE